jgi:hypothetical protein
VDVDTDIEPTWANNRSPNGVVTRRETFVDDEVAIVGGMAVTTAERTAFDLARRGSVGPAVARLDALASTTATTIASAHVGGVTSCGPNTLRTLAGHTFGSSPGTVGRRFSCG